MKAREQFLFLSLALCFYSCGGPVNEDVTSERAPLPDTSDTIVIDASITFEPLERNDGSVSLTEDRLLRLPRQLEVTQGNSGVGFASLSIGNRKYCYKGTAFDERDPTGEVYLFQFSYNDPVALCGFEDGDGVFNPTVEGAQGEDIVLRIEEPGCSFDAGTCVFTRVEAVLLTEEN